MIKSYLRATVICFTKQNSLGQITGHALLWTLHHSKVIAKEDLTQLTLFHEVAPASDLVPAKHEANKQSISIHHRSWTAELIVCGPYTNKYLRPDLRSALRNDLLFAQSWIAVSKPTFPNWVNRDNILLRTHNLPL